MENTPEDFQNWLKENFEKNVKKFAKEASPNSMTIDPTSKRLFWRPNNYRRVIEINRPINLSKTTIQSAIDPTIKVEQSDHTKLISITRYKNVILQIGKTKIVAIHPQNIIQGEKEIFMVEGENITDMQHWIFEKYLSIGKELDEALISFCKTFNLIPKSRPKWSRYEDFLRGDDFLDKIPRDVIIHAKIGKKVYAEGWEFHNSGDNENPTARMVNYIEERALEKNTPIIAKKLDEIEAQIKIYSQSVETLKAYQEQIALHLDVEKRQLENQIKMNELLERMMPPKPILQTLKDSINSLNDLSLHKDKIISLNAEEHKAFEEWVFDRFKEG